MPATIMTCRSDARRRALYANPQWNGIDYVELSDDQLTLSVYFFGAAPAGLAPANILIEGGRSITGIVATAIAAAPAGSDGAAQCVQISLDQYGDFSTYTLRLIETVQDGEGNSVRRPLPGFDSRYDHIDFNFKIGCPNDFDCATTPVCMDAPPVLPTIDYTAKDYESFRQRMFDRLALTMPDWRERHVPDIGVTLVELLAYVGDQLSYYQDAVATEAYLDTARTRISVRRHARLVDYRLHEGCNARAWLAIGCNGQPLTLPGGKYYFVTAAQALRGLAKGRVILESDLQSVASNLYEVFEPLAAADVPLDPSLDCLRFYTWGDEECCLSKGARRATLLDPSPPAPLQSPVVQSTMADSARNAQAAPGAAAETATAASASKPLAAGDVLIFEEVVGPTTGNPVDADPAHRCAVRLTQVDYATDPLFGTAIVEIEWAQDDALPFALCISARLPAPDCRCVGDISVARGNVILVDHGASVGESLGTVESAGGAGCCACEGVVLDTLERAQDFTPALANGPLVHAQRPPADASAAAALKQDPREALAWIAISETTACAGDAVWQVRCDLLQSPGDERDFVVEVDDDGRGHLRFGDGRLGRRPQAGAGFQASYRVGDPVAGNVAAEAIAYIVFRDSRIYGAGLAPRNPLPAQGGTAAETLAEAKLAAPLAFRNTLRRAISADDYARLAEKDARLQRANAQLQWNGSWYEADVAIDPLGEELADAALCAQIDEALCRYRRVGHDLAVRGAEYVPLAITLQVCVRPDYLQAQVRAAVAAALGNRRLADGALGFFHPDRQTFGGAIYASDLIAAAQKIDGVQSVNLVELRRLDAPYDAAPSDAPAPGELQLAGWQIAQVDNDPNYPEHGQLKLAMGGGR